MPVPNEPQPSPPRPRLSRLIVWNLLLSVAGLTSIIVAGEIYLWLTVPFVEEAVTRRFVPGVGLLYAPNTELRFTNRLDYWTKTRTNSLGFIDREPPSNRRAIESCHVTVIGDSFVEAREVPINAKIQVQLEKLSHERISDLDVTTSAFGRSYSSQIDQISLYDHYARDLQPDLVVLVFVDNDFIENSAILRYLNSSLDPDHPPFPYAVRLDTREIFIRPPDPAYSEFRRDEFDPRFDIFPSTFFGQWLNRKLQPTIGGVVSRIAGHRPKFVDNIRTFSQRPHFAWITEDWTPTTRQRLVQRFLEDEPPRIVSEALAFTAFGLAEFKRRADRDGLSLVILASHTVSPTPSHLQGLSKSWRDVLSGIAAAKGIPVIYQEDHIRARGGRIEDVHFANDLHWNSTGHRWAAEAVVEYLRQNPDICGIGSSAEVSH